MTPENLTLDNWRHFRDVPEKTRIQRRVELGDNIMNVLDDLNVDIPVGSWSLKKDPSATKVI